MKYVLDTNILITAKNLYYGFDFCPAFWDWLTLKFDDDIVCSIDKVKDEIFDGEDLLSEWVKQHPDFFRQTDNHIEASLRIVSEWVNHQQYTNAAIATFLSSADFFLIGHALADNLTVVSLEKNSDTKNRVVIPVACSALHVLYIDTFSMLRQERALFKL